MSIGKLAKALSGTAAAWGVSALATLIYVSITSRIYSPDIVASYTVGLAALTIGGILLGSGLTMNLQRAPLLEAREEARHVGLSIVAGIILAFLMVAFADIWAGLWGVPGSAAFTRFLGIVALVTPLSTLTAAQLRRSTRHGKASLVLAISSVISAGVGVAAAVHFKSPLALATPNILLPWLLVFGAAIAGANLRPAFGFKIPERNYVAGAVTYNLMNYLSYNLIPWGIGRFVAPSALGLFSRAYLLASTPVQGIAGSISNTLLSEYRNLSDPKQSRMLTDLLAVTSSLSMLMLAVMSALSTPEIRLVLGSQWIATIPVFVALTLALTTLIPQWTLSLALQALYGFGQQRWSRLAMLALGAIGATAVALTHNIYAGILVIGATQCMGHIVDLYVANQCGLIDLKLLGRVHVRLIVATSPLFALGIAQAIGLWAIADFSGYAMLGSLGLLALAYSAAILRRGATGRIVRDYVQPALLRARASV